tara:strand:- start:38395 stop:38790 length:396 start_codon:yes stop_codon:yes gene_type:complete
MKTGIVIVDHGSKRDESNAMLERVAKLFADKYSHQYKIVEPAHMELAEPSIETAYERCVERGAQNIIICPFFLSRGKHWKEDIPSLANNAAKKFPHTKYHVALPLGVDSLILDLLDKRIGGVPESAFKLPV